VWKRENFALLVLLSLLSLLSLLMVLLLFVEERVRSHRVGEREGKRK